MADYKKLLRLDNFFLFKTLSKKIKIISQKKFVKLSIPFMLFVVGGSFGLKEWTRIRYQFNPNKGVSKEEEEKLGSLKTRKPTLEEIYEEIKEIDTENWENIRGPRPWENNMQTPKNQNKK